MKIRNIAVFCGAKYGHEDRWRTIASYLGRQLALRGTGLVWGGGHVGLMGAVADAVLDNSGTAIGVIPQFLADLEDAYPRATELHIVTSMHERKAMMADRADAFIALPGGFGTLDELFEILTWRQLGLHNKPVGLLNQSGYFHPLLAMLDNMVEEGFLDATHRDSIVVSGLPNQLLDMLESAALRVSDVPRQIASAPSYK